MGFFAIFMSLVGAVKKVSSDISRAQHDREVAARNAQVANEEANDAVVRAGIPGSRARMAGSQVIGEQKAAFAASGVDVGAGSARTAAANTRFFSDMDEAIIRNNAAREAFGYRVKANLFLTQGELEAKSAENDATSSVIGGISQAGGQFGKMYSERTSTVSQGVA